MKRLEKYFAIIIAFLFLFGCAGTLQSPRARINSLGLADISGGLPREGLWREKIALADMYGDGYLDIVAPPPRKAEKAEDLPHIFLRDRKEGRWQKGAFTFPTVQDYGYGGIAVGDINRDGYLDIVLAVYSGRIILLENNKSNGFIERPFPVNVQFHSRTVEISDINGDGWPDIIALSEAPAGGKSSGPQEILAGINKEAKGWDVKTLEGSRGLFGDSMAVADIKGDGKKDIIIAPMIAKKDEKKLIWFGDGKGDFKPYEGDLRSHEGDLSGYEGDLLASFVRAGDLDGDGKDEVVLKVSTFGKGAKVFLSAHRWTGAGFADISKGLEAVKNPIVFDLSDVDGDGKKELIVLSTDGIRIYKYMDKGWVERGYYELSPAETSGASDLRAGRNRDGSLLIVYNLGDEGETLNRGIRAYLMK